MSHFSIEISFRRHFTPIQSGVGLVCWAAPVVICHSLSIILLKNTNSWRFLSYGMLEKKSRASIHTVREGATGEARQNERGKERKRCRCKEEMNVPVSQ